MSIFDDDNDDLKKSVRFFNLLPDEEKVKIVSNLSPQFFQQKQEYEQLFALLSKIQQDISTHSDIEIGNKLVEHGLEETYARLFVANVKKHAPTPEYQLNQLNMIPDEVFSKNIASLLHDIWVKGKTDEQLSERYNIDKEKVVCLIIFTANVFNMMSRGETYKEDVKEKYKHNLSYKKMDALLEQISIYQDHNRKVLMFRNMQDAAINTERIARQNNEMLRLLQELVDLRRRESRDHNTR